MQQPDTARLWSKDFLRVAVLNSLIFLAFQMLLPTIPLYVKRLGGSDGEAGLVMGVFAISAVLIRPLIGQTMDRYGRKGIFLAGLLLFGASILANTLASSLILLLMVRLLYGFGWGSCQTAATTVASDLIPKTRFGEGIGYFSLTGTVTMALGPALGMFLVNRLGFGPMFLSAALLAGVAAWLALTIAYPRCPAVPERLSLVERTAIPATAVGFFVAMTYCAVITFLGLYATDLGIGNVGPFFTAYVVALLVTRPFIGRIADRYGFAVILVPGLLLTGAAMLLLYLARDLGAFLWAGLLFGLGYGSVNPGLTAMAVKDAPSERRGAANSTFFTGFDLGVGLGSILWGAVAQIAGYRMMYLWTIVPICLALFCLLALGRKESLRPALERAE
ncbi:putative MFS family arabinose efflux permease [Hydrogenispora ethanolica]|uniref:Putative MFS family arabinose efflux permease n=1 Tax=Hydrogenispora ethanolica TaxID=1082276 RepID=A0A4R1QUR8_HYDET|nr:MFS transporter [Hydrogenispora ethanolica]TCL57706.1 putative MFS family arabinose efflux permease [Hydrogenispora ethanolica]